MKNGPAATRNEHWNLIPVLVCRKLAAGGTDCSTIGGSTMLCHDRCLSNRAVIQLIASVLALSSLNSGRCLGQLDPEITSLKPLTNAEVELKLTLVANRSYDLLVSTNPLQWPALMTFVKPG